MADSNNNELDLEQIISDALSAKKRRLQALNENGGSEAAVTEKESAAEPNPVQDVIEPDPIQDTKEPAMDKEGQASPDLRLKPAAARTAADSAAPKRQRQEVNKGDEPDIIPAAAPKKKAPRPAGQHPKRSREDAQPSRRQPNGARKQQPDRSEQNSKKPAARKKKKWTKKQMIFLIVGLIFILLCLLGIALFLIFHYYWNKTGGEWSEAKTSERMVVSQDDPTQSNTFNPETEEDRIKKQLQNIQIDLMKDEDVFNVLLVGQDLRTTANTDEQSNTDVMLLLSLNQRTKQITMTSFMRDLWMYLPPCQYSDRLNAAFFAGGPEYLRETLETYFGVSINRYVVVNFNQFTEIVDTLGGLDLYVTPQECNGEEGADPLGDNTRGMQNPLDEQNRIMGNPVGTDYIKMSYDIKGQTVHMNGNQALAYSRIRHVDYIPENGSTQDAAYSDFGRTKRQRIVINKIIEKARGASLVQLNNLANLILPNIRTDIEEGEAASLLLNMLDYANYDVQEMRIPEEGTYSGHWIDGKSVILCNTLKNAMDLQQKIYGITNIDEEMMTKLKEFAQQNAYLDDDGNWVDYYNGGVTWVNPPW